MVADQLVDTRASLVTLCYNPDFSLDLLAEWREKSGLAARLAQLEK